MYNRTCFCLGSDIVPLLLLFSFFSSLAEILGFDSVHVLRSSKTAAPEQAHDQMTLVINQYEASLFPRFPVSRVSRETKEFGIPFVLCRAVQAVFGLRFGVLVVLAPAIPRGPGGGGLR